jgi:hypothetical protein
MSVSGHAYIKERKRGAQWYVKYRLADGRQIKKRLGPAWTDRGRPPAGYFTRRSAEARLNELLTDARRGTLHVTRTGATFADAAAEFLRYLQETRERDPVTIRDYRGVIDGYLTPRVGERATEGITPDDVAAYRDDLKAQGRKLRQVPEGEQPREGKLSNRVIVRHLCRARRKMP